MLHLQVFDSIMYFVLNYSLRFSLTLSTVVIVYPHAVSLVVSLCEKISKEFRFKTEVLVIYLGGQ